MTGWLIDEDDTEYPSAGTQGFRYDHTRSSRLDESVNDESGDDAPDSQFESSPEDATGWAPDFDDPDWTPESGFADPTDAVRIWGDEDGNLTRFRLAIGWQNKLRVEELGQVLSECFETMDAYFHPDTEIPAPPEPEPDPAGTAMSWAYLRSIRDRQAELMTRANTMGPDRPSGWSGVQAVGDDWDDSVAVRLNVLGYPIAVAFVPGWLREASNHDITSGVMGAYRKARSRFIPPDPVWSEHMLAGIEAQRLTLGVHRAMRGGLQS